MFNKALKQILNLKKFTIYWTSKCLQKLDLIVSHANKFCKVWVCFDCWNLYSVYLINLLTSLATGKFYWINNLLKLWLDCIFLVWLCFHYSNKFQFKCTNMFNTCRIVTNYSYFSLFSTVKLIFFKNNLWIASSFAQT